MSNVRLFDSQAFQVADKDDRRSRERQHINFEEPKRRRRTTNKMMMKEKKEKKNQNKQNQPKRR